MTARELAEWVFESPNKDRPRAGELLWVHVLHRWRVTNPDAPEDEHVHIKVPAGACGWTSGARPPHGAWVGVRWSEAWDRPTPHKGYQPHVPHLAAAIEASLRRWWAKASKGVA